MKNFPVGYDVGNPVPILPYGVLAHLVVLRHHNRHHRDVDTTVVVSRAEAWSVKARKIAASIDAKCRLCKEKRKQFMQQRMGDLPEFRTQISPPFSVVLMDLFGPFEIRDDVIKRGSRVMKKAWGVVFSCATTRAVQLDVCTDYSTESVLHCVRRLMAVRGDVKVIISDPGSQLVAASKELVDWRSGWNMEQLKRFGASHGLEWTLIMPDSQHQNGASEILVKLVKGVKLSLLRVLGSKVLSLNETFTVLMEVANLVNERPIGIKPGEQSAVDYLSPNSLLLGRSSDRICSGPFSPDGVLVEDPEAVKTRFLLVQAMITQFWNTWVKLYFPTLLVRSKWHVDKRNVEVNDICMLRESNMVRGDWRLCEVAKVFPDARGQVRNVAVMVKAKQGSSSTYVPTLPIEVKRHVSNLILLVPAEERAHYQDKI